MSVSENEAMKIKMEGDLALLEKAGEVGEAIGQTAVKGYEAVEKGVTQGYKKIEEGVVGAYKKVEDKFVDKFLTHEGESVEDAKRRLAEEQDAHKGDGKH